MHLNQQYNMEDKNKTFLVISYLDKVREPSCSAKPKYIRIQVIGFFIYFREKMELEWNKSIVLCFCGRKQKTRETIKQFMDELEGLPQCAYSQMLSNIRDREKFQKNPNECLMKKTKTTSGGSKMTKPSWQPHVQWNNIVI